MTAAQRNQFRVAIDAHKRAALAKARGPTTDTCRGCGTDHDTYTTGCTTCSNRRHNRHRYTNPEYRRQQADKHRERRRAKVSR